MQRGGFPFKGVLFALLVIGTVYLLYLYNSTIDHLRNTELLAERYRREEETKVAQLQDIMKSKDELQERCENDKREFTNRLNSLNQQHKMLKSQYDEHEVEQMRLEQEARRLREEFDQVEVQRNQEYQHFKAEKELEISTLKDQIANIQRQNEQLHSEIANLRNQLQIGKQQLLQQQQQAQLWQQPQHQQQPVFQNLPNNNQQPLQQAHLVQQPQQQLAAFENLSNHLQNHPQGVVNMPAVGDIAEKVKASADLDSAVGLQGGIEAQHKAVDNEQHQVAPPNNLEFKRLDRPDAPVNSNVGGHPVVEEKNEAHQVAPPKFDVFPANDKHGDAVDVGAGAGEQQHEDPLALKQIQQPDFKIKEKEDHKGNEWDVENGNVLQKVPPAHAQAQGFDNEAGDKRQDIKPVAPQDGL